MEELASAVPNKIEQFKIVHSNFPALFYVRFEDHSISN